MTPEERRERQRAASRKYHAKNRERRNAAAREKRAADPEPHRERCRKWREANRDYAREAFRKWYEANREAQLERMRKWQAAHPEYGSGWRKGNADRVASYASARRALRRDAFVEHVDHETVFDRDGWCCQICGKKTAGAWPDLHSASLDHIVPLSGGGEHSYANTQCAHLRCNIQKGDSTQPAANDHRARRLEVPEVLK